MSSFNDLCSECNSSTCSCQDYFHIKSKPVVISDKSQMTVKHVVQALDIALDLCSYPPRDTMDAIRHRWAEDVLRNVYANGVSDG